MTNYLKLGITLLAFLAFFNACEKLTDQKVTDQPATAGTKVTLAAKDQGRPTSAHCVVPIGFTSCSSSCFFSDCCIVWDPRKETGGCSCFFGFASCGTSAISTNTRTSAGKSTSTRNITVHVNKVESLIEFCKANGIAIESVEASYKTNLLLGLNNTLETDVVVQPDLYDIFITDYKTFINSLNTSQLNLVKNYIG